MLERWLAGGLLVAGMLLFAVFWQAAGVAPDEGPAPAPAPAPGSAPEVGPAESHGPPPPPERTPPPESSAKGLVWKDAKPPPADGKGKHPKHEHDRSDRD